MVWMINNQIESRRNIEVAAKIRLGLKKKSILSKQAQERMMSGKKLDPVPNFAQGRVRDIIDKSAGVCHGTVDKFEYIEQHAPKLADDLCAGKVVDDKKNYP